MLAPGVTAMSRAMMVIWRPGLLNAPVNLTVSA
jgi:hypothetical protein